MATKNKRKLNHARHGAYKAKRDRTSGIFSDPDGDVKPLLQGYLRKTIYSAAVLLGLITVGIGIAKIFSFDSLVAPLVGGLCGVTAATINLFAIGYAFFVVAIIKGKKIAILWPVLSFIAMCVVAYLFAILAPSMILGFALGLTVPLLFGAVIVFL